MHDLDLTSLGNFLTTKLGSLPVPIDICEDNYKKFSKHKPEKIEA